VGILVVISLLASERIGIKILREEFRSDVYGVFVSFFPHVFIGANPVSFAAYWGKDGAIQSSG